MLHPIEDSVIDHGHVPMGLIQLAVQGKMEARGVKPGRNRLLIASHGYHTVVRKFMSKEQTYYATN